jgi:hypothetical protein
MTVTDPAAGTAQALPGEHHSDRHDRHHAAEKYQGQ